MCLGRVLKRKFPDKKKIRTGWKVFLYTDKGDCYFEYQPLPHSTSKIVPIARWLCSSTTRIANWDVNYPNGFHIFPHRGHAAAWRIKANAFKDRGYIFKVVKVQYRHVVASGYVDDDKLVHVARRMYVPHQ